VTDESQVKEEARQTQISPLQVRKNKKKISLLKKSKKKFSSTTKHNCEEFEVLGQKCCLWRSREIVFHWCKRFSWQLSSEQWVTQWVNGSKQKFMTNALEVWVPLITQHNLCSPPFASSSPPSRIDLFHAQISCFWRWKRLDATCPRSKRKYGKTLSRQHQNGFE
jgi:hypothetical protein